MFADNRAQFSDNLPRPNKYNKQVSDIRLHLKASDVAVFDSLFAEFQEAQLEVLRRRPVGTPKRQDIAGKRSSVTSPSSNRVSFIEADDAVAYEQPVERRRASQVSAAGGVFSAEYLGGRAVVKHTLSRDVPLGLTLEGGVDTGEPERGIRVQGVRKLCAAYE